MTNHQWAEIFHQMGLLPFAWMLGLRSRGVLRGRAWWVMSFALGVSWVADWIPHLASPWLASVVFPVSQASGIALVLLDRDDAMTFTMALMAAGIASVTFFGVDGPDVLLSTVAMLGVAGIALKYRAIGRVRLALLVYFGGGQLAWLALSAWILHCHKIPSCLASPTGMEFGYQYQTMRAVGILVFCWAALSPKPLFTVSSMNRARWMGIPSRS